MKLPQPQNWWDNSMLKDAEIQVYDNSLELSPHSIYMKALLDEEKPPWIDEIYAIRWRDDW